MVYALSTEPGEEGRKNMFPEEMDITPSVEDLPADKPENEEEKEEDTSSGKETENNMEDLENIAREAGFVDWKAIVIEGCMTRVSSKPLFDAGITEKEAKALLKKDKTKYSVLFNLFSAIVDSEQVKADKG
jgi:hypothetical protein